MKRFTWPLERLLQVTGQRERVVRSELFKLAGQIAQVRREMVRRQAVVRSVLADLAGQAAEVRLPQQQLFLGWSEIEIRQGEALRGELRRMEGVREERMRQLVTVRQSRRKLEQLRHRAWREYQRQVAQWEQKQLDETAQIGFVRKAQSVAQAAAGPN